MQRGLLPIARGIGRSLARFAGLSFALLGAWIFAVNITLGSYSAAIRIWILSAGLMGLVGGVMFLLSFDGPARFRIRRARIAGWLGMLGLASVPTSLSFLLVGMLILTVPSVLRLPAQREFIDSRSEEESRVLR